MDLKFTFAKTTGTPHDTAASPAPLSLQPLQQLSTELIVKVTASADKLVGTATGAEGNSYANQEKPLTGAADATAYRSVISRVIAELDEKLASAVTKLQIPAAALQPLLDAEFITPAATTTQLLQLRSGITAGTAVEAY